MDNIFFWKLNDYSFSPSILKSSVYLMTDCMFGDS